MTTTLERLVRILLKTYKLEPESLTADRRLDDLGVDSLGVGLLLFDLEDEFQIKFGAEPGRLETLADVVVYIDQVVMLQRPAPQPSAPPGSAS